MLDDWGYSLKQVPALTSIRQPLTVAVLPELAHSLEVSNIARRSGHAVILHMPMEAMDPHVSQEKGTLLVGMSRAQALAALDKALASVPDAQGVNNHQGSKATSDLVLMRVVLQELKRRGIFYLDSFVTKQSVCEQAAQEIGIRFARRDVFLDNVETPAAIQKQMALLAQTAAKRGYAIGIGHDRTITLQVLKEAVPALERAGYRLVPLSELTQEEK